MSAGVYLSHQIGAIPGRKVLARYLDTTGDGTGTKTLIGAPATLLITPPAGRKFIIERVSVYIEDGGGFDTDLFGSLAALADGDEFRWATNPAAAGLATYVDFLDGLDIRQNSHFLRAGFEREFYTTGAGNDAALWVFDFGKFMGSPVVLDAGAAATIQGRLEWTNTTTHLGVADFRVLAHGWEI